jgi:Zn-dependent M16 (insulinase) family peptidase
MYLCLGKHNKHIVFELSNLRYLNTIMYIVANQLTRYNNAQSDVIWYAMSAMASTDYIELLSTYSKRILHPQLYEELKTLTLM